MTRESALSALASARMHAYTKLADCKALTVAASRKAEDLRLEARRQELTSVTLSEEGRRLSRQYDEGQAIMSQAMAADQGTGVYSFA
jgi:hypothetical protein